MRDYGIVVDDCAAPRVRGILHVRTRDTEYGTKNFALRTDDVAAGLPTVLTDRHLDWLDVLGALFAIDMACERGAGDLDWSRAIEAWIPVRDPDFWETRRPQFESVWTDLTQDDLHIHFEPSVDAPGPPRQSRRGFNDHAGVALLSGGQDSFAGALDLVSSGTRPLMLSHTASGATNSAQVAVEAHLQTLDTSVKRVKMGAGRAQGQVFPGAESSQRSRTMFFTGVAALVAHVGGSNRVFLNENGIMAVHVPLTPARVGSLSTHTASPPIVASLQELACDSLAADVSIENIFVRKTKPEVVECAAALGFGPAMIDTVSCWQIGRSRTHCGVCAPCIMRRISCEIHSVDDVVYDADVFDDAASLDDSRARDNLAHFVSLVMDLAELGDADLEYEYPELLNGAPAMSLADTVQLHRRWADQASSVLFSHPVPTSLR